MGYVFVPADATSDKNKLCCFVAGLMIDNCEDLGLLKSLHNDKIQKFYEIGLKDADHMVASFIKKSLKLSYGGSRFFGISSIERNEFIIDLRKVIQDH